MNLITTDNDGAAIILDAARSRHAHQPQQVVRRVLRPLDRYSHWQSITRAWSPVRGMTFNLARYLTTWIPSVNDECPLLTRCIHFGIEGWEDVEEGASDRERYYGYLRGLLYPLPEVLEWRIGISNSDQIGAWNPFEATLLAWWKSAGGMPTATRRRRPADSSYVEVSPADFRLIVLLRFLLRGADTIAPLAGRLEHLVSRYG